MFIDQEEIRRVRRELLRYDDADATYDEDGFGHPDRGVDFTIRPVSEEWRFQDRRPAYRTARANVQYIWRDGVGSDRFGRMPSWFGQRGYDLRARGLLLPSSAPLWATSGYEVWDRIDAATAATGDPTAVSAWHILAQLPPYLDERWWEWLAVSFAERHIVRRGAPVAYAVHSLAAPDRDWAISPHLHMVVGARRYRSGERHGERMPSWIGSVSSQMSLERAWRTTCGWTRIKAANTASRPWMASSGEVSERAIYAALARELKLSKAERLQLLSR